MGQFTLRTYQQDGVSRLRASYRAGRKAPLYVLPTGGGKTAVFSHIAEGAKSKGKRVTILVHRQELLLQASRSLDRLAVPHGIISPRYASLPGEPVQIASVQTLVRRLEGSYSAPDVIVIDEAHHATSNSYRKIIATYPNALLLGVTATPIRSDGNGLGRAAGGIFDDLVLGPSIGELIDQGHLVRPEVYAPPVGVDLTGVHRRMGDYDKHELAERIDKPKITGSAVEHYLKHCPGEPAIAFCVSVRHAEHVAEEFRAAGIRAVRVDGAMDDATRKDHVEGLGNGKFDVLTSADLIGEGVDIPKVSAAILLRPTYSLGLYLQQVGRALRPHEGKTRALILDHCGNTLRFGMPDDDREWSLEGIPRRGTSNRDAPIVRVSQCSRCFFVYESGPENCPACGNYQPSKPREIGAVDGELQKLTKEAIEAAKRSKKIEQAAAKTVEELHAIATARGYKNPRKWAEHVFNGRKHR